jgi:chromosome segregation protein
VYLKRLTLRGFKSFASATSLRLEPGITCVVGPNGSGKSNVVDALSWVMGEQGAKSLRGGKMEDVVFAGTTSRAPLGRAEVALTIDNSDGSLPIDYAEVTISRLMFRSGQSEYAINGDHCRLLDVQDLLSDSGLGREMHVIVGQGQLDQILHAGPEARRALIEEAAGVLKHRKRKEKALRKLEAMQANLTRLVDLTAELNRRLKPLGRQAEIARRAATIQADLRDAKLRLLADDYMTLRTKLEREEADEAAIRARRAELEENLAIARAQEEALDLAAAERAAGLARAQQTWFALSSTTERLRALAGLAAERARLLAAAPEPERAGRDPDELDRQAAELREEEAGLTERLTVGREVLTAAVEERTEAEGELADTERRLADNARAAAGRAERLARLRGQADAADSRSAAGQEELGRLLTAAAQARDRAERARQEYSEVQDVADDRDEDRSGLAAAHEAAAAAHSQCKERAAALRRAERQANSDVAAHRARKEALEETLRRGADGSSAVLADPARFRGVLGSFAERLSVTDGFETAIAAALGAAADAIAVSGLDAALAVLAELASADSGSVSLVIAHPGPAPSAISMSHRGGSRQVDVTSTWSGAASAGGATADAGAGERGAEAAGAGAAGVRSGGSGLPPLPGDARWALDLVRAPAELAGAVTELLAGVAVARELEEAGALVRENPGLRVVTRTGTLVGEHWAQGGSARPRSLLDVRAAADEAAARLAEADERCDEAGQQLATAADAEEAARRIVDETLSRMQAADAAAAEISGRLGRLAGAARAARDEADRLDAAIGAARRAAEKDLTKLAQIRRELVEAEAQDEDFDPDAQPEDDGREAMALRCTAARNAEMEARLEVRTVEERLRAISGRADSLAAAAAAERAARQRARQAREQRTAQAAVARSVASGAELAVRAAEESLAQAQARKEEAEAANAGGTTELKAVRTRVSSLASELDKVVNTAHGTEIARAEHRLRLEQLEGHAAEEFGITPEVLVGEYGPDVPVPVNDPEPASDGKAKAKSAPMSVADALRAVTEAARAEEDGEAPVLESSASEAVTVRIVPYVREDQEKRAEAAERQLARLGKVNPLALEEYAALQERHAFLATQLEDLRKTRRDLLTVVKEVDDRVQEVFAAAYEDTQREFEGLFARLFPGGSGRLLLTEPDDMLTTGIEIEARPPGKKVKRLSLLSGGERSLTAIAYLFAIFKARPSPFYVLDEVEAALDDTNMQRLLRVFEELRESSQLIVITHQRRTMEAADALYGISMRGDGVSQVISQRVREREPA